MNYNSINMNQSKVDQKNSTEIHFYQLIFFMF